MTELDKLKRQITAAIDSCKAYGTDDAQLIIFAYQNVLRWMAAFEEEKDE